MSKLLPIGFFYLNYYYLLPRFFEKRKLSAYFSIVIAVIIVIAAQEIAIRKQAGMRFFQMPVERSHHGIKEKGFNFLVVAPGDSANLPMPMPARQFEERTFLGVSRGMLLMSINRSVSLCVVLLLIGGLIRLAYSFLKNQNEKKALENAHLNAEVNFLKSQINPHFLFNTLNNIYSQAHNRSEHTEYSILKFSDLLRYVLYESGSEKVPLEKDILYINNYIDLQRMRLSSKVIIDYAVTGVRPGYSIAPLLLISFIENAFKHGISYTQTSTIHIALTFFEKTLTLQVINPIVKTDTFAHGGLGLKNAGRRLDLLYPGKHTLDIFQNDQQYIVNLKINLESD
ncbi:MAG: histidine kinase [Chitinophagaceae bacterium]